MLAYVVRALKNYQYMKATGEIIFIGYRGICDVISEVSKHNSNPMDICRKVNLLIEEGVLEKVVIGKSGMFTHQANGYRFLKWRPPTSPHDNPDSPKCVTNRDTLCVTSEKGNHERPSESKA